METAFEILGVLIVLGTCFSAYAILVVGSRESEREEKEREEERKKMDG